VENEAFDDERDGTARDRVAGDLEVESGTEKRAHAEYVLLVGVSRRFSIRSCLCLLFDVLSLHGTAEVSPGTLGERDVSTL
jgi:hypothetical protein